MSQIKKMVKDPKRALSLLGWLAGKYLTEVTTQDWTWFFDFSHGGSIVTESHWRLFSREGIIVTSEDHGHQFGLPAPVDAASRVTTLVKGQRVERFEVAELSSDLTLFFENGARLQFINLSCGYESWRTLSEDGEVYCLGGGELAIVEN